MRSVYRCVVLFFVFSVLLTGCFMSPQEGQRRPCFYPGTTWESTDGAVRFAVDEHYQCYGTITVDEEIQDVYIYFGMELNRSIYFVDYTEWVKTNQLNHIERWDGYFKSENHFTAIVRETTYFEEGQEFTFYRIDK